MQVAYLIFTLIVFAGTAGVCVWLHRRMLASGVVNLPYWRLMALVVTYGAALYVFLSIIMFFNEMASTNIAIDSSTTIGVILEMIAPVLWVYVIVIAPVVILVIGGMSFIKKGDSIYHRVVYFACAGYTFLLLSLFILVVSRCNPPHGGPP